MHRTSVVSSSFGHILFGTEDLQTRGELSSLRWLFLSVGSSVFKLREEPRDLQFNTREANKSVQTGQVLCSLLKDVSNKYTDSLFPHFKYF